MHRSPARKGYTTSTVPEVHRPLDNRARPRAGPFTSTRRHAQTPERAAEPSDSHMQSNGLPLQHLCSLMEQVEAALEADKRARLALHETLSETQSLRNSILSASPDVSGLSALDSTSSTAALPAQRLSFSTTPLRTPLQPEDLVEIPLHSGPHQAWVPPSTQMPSHHFANDSCRDDSVVSQPSQVYSRTIKEKDSKIKDLNKQLEAEKQVVRELKSALEVTKAHMVREQEALIERVTTLQQQLADTKDRLRDIELERDVFTAHKDSLVNALKHERSLVNYAIAKLEQHSVDATPLKQMQQQFAVDTIGGTYVSTIHSVPPAIGGLTSSDRSPEQRKVDQHLGPPMPHSVRLSFHRHSPIELDDYDD